MNIINRRDGSVCWGNIHYIRLNRADDQGSLCSRTVQNLHLSVCWRCCSERLLKVPVDVTVSQQRILDRRKSSINII